MSSQRRTGQGRTLDELREELARVEAGQDRGTNSVFAGDCPQPEAAQGDSARSEYEKARAIVLRKLAGSPKTRHQVAETLRERELQEQTILQVLNRMEEVSLLDDAAFARTWVRTRHELKGLGSSALRRELKERGVAEGHIEEALTQLSAEDEESAARSMVERKLGERSLPSAHTPEGRAEQEKLTRRLVSMLARRGHSPGAAFRIVQDVIGERAST